MRRLYVQIYLTIIAALVLVVVISGVLWQFSGADRFNREAFGIAGRLAVELLAPVGAPLERQQRTVHKLAENIGLDISLFDENKKLLASSGQSFAAPSPEQQSSNRFRHRGNTGWQILLPDKRWLVTKIKKNHTRFFWAPLLFLASVAIIIGLSAYPLVRRLTRRLERLQRGVEAMGAGDFSTRVAIEGKDEVAQLGGSFNQAAEKIETLLGAHRQLLANASHELRTPLSRIRLGIDLLKGQEDEPRKKALEQDIDELDQLVDEILLMSRLDANNEHEPWQEIDLLAVAAEECARYDAQYQDCNLDGRSVLINGDLRLMQRMVRNLLENAYRHGKPPVDIRVGSKDGFAMLEIVDHGPGIPKDEREKVFAPFYRLSDRQDVKGSGLGLALVLQIVESHKGQVELFDDGQSDRFGVRVMLPLE